MRFFPQWRSVREEKSTMSECNHYYSPSLVKARLDKAIDYASSSVGCYCANPGIDFTRERKLTVGDTINFLIRLSNRSINSELMNLFDDVDKMPSASAICQRRRRLGWEIMRRVFHLFTGSFQGFKTYKGYSLIACDGSDINISRNAEDAETYHAGTSATGGYNQIHLNALYDLYSRVFYDVSVDTASKKGECASLINMIKGRRYPPKSIIICDRGYESYNLMAACIERGQKFIIRVKDIGSNGILSNMGLPNCEFDTYVTKIVTRVNNKATMSDSRYAVLMNGSPFDYVSFENEYYEMRLRVVRFRIPGGGYECLVTNLSEEEMGFEEFKEIYHLRWNEETGFRDLKYTIGALYFHSSDRGMIIQELYASLILHNYCRIIAEGIPTEGGDGWKWRYKSCFKIAVTNVRRYMADEIGEEELVKRIRKFLTPIRPGRAYARKIRPQCAKSPSYYAA